MKRAHQRGWYVSLCVVHGLGAIGRGGSARTPEAQSARPVRSGGDYRGLYATLLANRKGGGG